MVNVSETPYTSKESKKLAGWNLPKDKNSLFYTFKLGKEHAKFIMEEVDRIMSKEE